MLGSHVTMSNSLNFVTRSFLKWLNVETVRIRHLYLYWIIWKGKCICIFQVCCEAILPWANRRTEMIVLLCLCSYPSPNLDVLQPRIYLSVPQLALGKCYSHFSGAGRELWTTRVHTGHQCKNRHWTSILLSHSTGTLTTEPNFLFLEPGQDTKCIHLAKGEGNPCIPSLFCFYLGGNSCSSHAGQGYINLMTSNHMFFSIS